jgi:hypothetical protein
MSSKRRLRRKSCTGKQRFVDQLEALAAVGRLVRSESFRGSHLSPYRCRFCKGFHFGHSPWRVRLRLA